MYLLRNIIQGFYREISNRAKAWANNETTHVPTCLLLHILVPRAHDLSGLRQESRSLGATISGMLHRCRLRETGWAEFGFFLCYFKMVATSALVFRRLVKGNEDSGNEIGKPQAFKTLRFSIDFIRGS